jgi:transcriptional regulator with XRE-family HTH domain
MPARKKGAQSEFQQYMEHIADALSAVAESHDDERLGMLQQTFDEARRAAWNKAPRTNADAWERPLSDSFGRIIGENIKALRNEAGWSQERLARAMETAGYIWKRITCAEVEASTRRVSLEELVGLAALFGVPLIELLLPREHVGVDLPERDLSRRDTLELLLGREGKLGEGGVDWGAPLEALPAVAERPAPDLWQSRGKADIPVRRRRNSGPA